MAKHYASYLFFGVLICYSNLFLWGFSVGAVNVMPYITLIASIILFAVAAGLIFYHTKIASIVGLVCLVLCAPMGYYIIDALIHGTWVFIAVGIIIILLFIYGALCSLKVIFNWGKPYDLTALSTTVKIGYAALPIFILFIWALFIYI